MACHPDHRHRRRRGRRGHRARGEPSARAPRAGSRARRASATRRASPRRRRRQHRRRPSSRPTGRERADETRARPTRTCRPSAVAARSSSTSPSTRKRSASTAGSSSTAGCSTPSASRSSGFGAAMPRPSSGRTGSAASAARSTSASSPTSSQLHRVAQRSRSTSPGPRLRRALPAPTTSPRRRRRSTARDHLHGHASRDRGALPAVRAPRLSRAVVPDLAVVRVPVPRLEVQPGRREEGRPRAAWPRPLLRDPSRRRQHRSSTPATSTSVRRSAPTRPDRTPRARCACDQHPSSRHSRRWIAAIWKNDLRHWLIWINFVAFVAIDRLPVCARCCRRSARREEKTAGEPHAVPRRRRPREPPPRARAGLGAAVRGRRRDRAAGLLAAGADPPAPVDQLLRQERGRPRRRSCSRTRRARRTTPHAVAAVRELPRRRTARAAGVASPRSTAVKVDWKVPPLNTEALRFEEDTDCLQPVDDATRRHDLRPHRHHHVRPAGHADAAVGCRRRRPEERPVDPRPRRVHRVDPAEARRSRRQQETPRPSTAARSDDPNDVVPAVHDVPGDAGAARRRRRSRPTARRSTTDRSALQKALEHTRRRPTPSSRRRAPTSQNRSTTRRRSRSTATQARRSRAATSSPRTTTVTTDQARARLDRGSGSKRRANVSDGQLLFELNCARCHTEGWSTFDSADPARPARRRRRPRPRPAAAAAPAAVSASTCATAT